MQKVSAPVDISVEPVDGLGNFKRHVEDEKILLKLYRTDF